MARQTFQLPLTTDPRNQTDRLVPFTYLALNQCQNVNTCIFQRRRLPHSKQTRIRIIGEVRIDSLETLSE